MYIANYSQDYTEWGKSEMISSKTRNEKRVYTSSTFVQYNAQFFISRNIATEIKRIQREKKGANLCQYADDMILYFKKYTVSSKENS
jgi:hypothetical protein